MPKLPCCFASEKNRPKLAYACGYVSFYNRVEAHVVEWHHTELEKLDSDYRIDQAGLRLVAAREKAHEAGIGPADSRYTPTSRISSPK